MLENKIFDLTPSELFAKLPANSIWIFVAVIVLFTAIYSVIFLYHWKKYGIHATALPYFTVLVYTIGTLFLLSIIIGAAVTISL